MCSLWFRRVDFYEVPETNEEVTYRLVSSARIPWKCKVLMRVSNGEVVSAYVGSCGLQMVLALLLLGYSSRMWASGRAVYLVLAT